MANAIIGRDAELAELEARAKRNRLVTIVGPGGVGKTTLARAVAKRLGSRHPLGVRHVDLARVEDAHGVRGALATQLGFDSFDALLSSPNDRPVLIVVDNCEHLLDPVAAAIVQVLGACHQPAVVATSRSPLEIPGESIVSLAPLPLPSDHGDALACPSVQLFLQRCRDAGANVTEVDLPVVVDLCQRLDGLPLAIEIAAARSRTMSVTEVAARLRESVDVLDRPRFRGDSRHRSVAETVRWSYDLLSPSQAELLDQLAVFAGPFTGDTAGAVAPPELRATLDGDLDELVNASLVAVGTVGPGTEYRLLDTVRRYALDQLSSRGGSRSAFDRFVDHVVVAVRDVVAGGTTQWRPTVVSDLVARFDDISEAMLWSIAHDESPTRAYELCSILWAIVHQGHADDIADLARRTLARWPDDGSARAAQVTAVLATAEYVTGHPERAIDLATATLHRLPAPDAAPITLHRVLGQARRAVGDITGSLDALRAGAALGHELGMTAMALELDVAAAQVTADAGDVDRALSELDAVVTRAAEIDSPLSTCWTRTAIGWNLLRKDPGSATEVIETALAQSRQIQYPIGVALGLRSRAYAQLLAGDVPGAIATVTELLHDLIQRGALSNARVLLDVTAAVAHRSGHAGWESLAATARSLPMTTLVCSEYELIALPPTAAEALPRHDSFSTVWQLLAELSATAPDDAAPDGAAATDVAPAATPQAGASIRRLGDLCEFTYAGRTATARAAKGVVDLVRVIEADGREIHCLDLIGASVEETSTGEVIDARARREYEQQIRDLQAEIEEAEGNSDFARAYKHQDELDTLIEHLTAALGRGRRTRQAAGSAERARSAVTHRVRTAIRQFERLHPALGRHLRHSVKTGIYCSYHPERETHWSIE